jgi:serine/threonine-protein kinase
MSAQPEVTEGFWIVADDANQKVAEDTSPAFGGEGDEKIGLGETSAMTDEEIAEAGKVVKICKQCMVSQADGGEFCVKCGSPLVPIRSVQESYIGDEVGGKYKIVDHLGSGGMGEVYLGLNEPLGQKVAVKFLGKKFTSDESVILRFLNEARSYCKVNHPNAVTLLEYGQHEDGALYLITEYIEGRSLTDVLKDQGPMPLEQVVSVGIQVCEVLSAAHEQGVIHRDLKPDNLMLMSSTRGRFAVKVLDFGIAKIVDDEDEHGPMTETGSVFGTPEFMSPEQARGETADPRSDLYAMGAILYYMISGKLPFKGKNKFVVLNKQLTERPVRPSEKRPNLDIPLRLESVIMKCLNKGPDERYQSADDLLEALEELRLPSGSSTDQQRAIGDEASEQFSPIDTPSHDRKTHPESIHADAGAPAEIGGSMETDPNRPADAELGTFDEGDGLGQTDFGEWDLDDEQDDEVAEMWAGSQPKWPRLVAALAAIAVIGLGAWFLFGEGASSADGEDPSGPKAIEKAELTNVLNTGQVQGSLSTAEDMIQRGELSSARRAIEQTYMWMDDDELPGQTRERRENLVGTLDKLEALGRKVESAVADGKCSRARRVAATAGEFSSGYADSLKTTVEGCSEPSGARSPSKPKPTRPDEPEQGDKPDEAAGGAGAGASGGGARPDGGVEPPVGAESASGEETVGEAEEPTGDVDQPAGGQAEGASEEADAPADEEQASDGVAEPPTEADESGADEGDDEPTPDDKVDGALPPKQIND